MASKTPEKRKQDFGDDAHPKKKAKLNPPEEEESAESSEVKKVEVKNVDAAEPEHGMVAEDTKKEESPPPPSSVMEEGEVFSDVSAGGPEEPTPKKKKKKKKKKKDKKKKKKEKKKKKKKEKEAAKKAKREAEAKKAEKIKEAERKEKKESRRRRSRSIPSAAIPGEVTKKTSRRSSRSQDRSARSSQKKDSDRHSERDRRGSKESSRRLERSGGDHRRSDRERHSDRHNRRSERERDERSSRHHEEKSSHRDEKSSHHDEKSSHRDEKSSHRDEKSSHRDEKSSRHEPKREERKNDRSDRDKERVRDRDRRERLRRRSRSRERERKDRGRERSRRDRRSSRERNRRTSTGATNRERDWDKMLEDLNKGRRNTDKPKPTPKKKESKKAGPTAAEKEEQEKYTRAVEEEIKAAEEKARMETEKKRLEEERRKRRLKRLKEARELRESQRRSLQDTPGNSVQNTPQIVSDTPARMGPEAVGMMNDTPMDTDYMKKSPLAGNTLQDESDSENQSELTINITNSLNSSQMSNNSSDTRKPVATETMPSRPRRKYVPIPEVEDTQEDSDEGDDFDMFNPEHNIDKIIKPAAAMVTAKITRENKYLGDEYDDNLGFYIVRPGDLIADRYSVLSKQGKGSFSTVILCIDTKEDNVRRVIKVINSKETMYHFGRREVQTLSALKVLDPENKFSCVRFYESFEFRNHLCMVFEAMQWNARKFIKFKSAGAGFHIDAVQRYARQMFRALVHIKRCRIIHCDIKPDNVLVSLDGGTVKLCDFGSAWKPDEVEITANLGSRFYRAPEIMVGLMFNFPIDVWSMGCVFAELYSGDILFKGSDNNKMLLLHQQIMGRFPVKIGRNGHYWEQHFDEQGDFTENKRDKVEGIEIKFKHTFTGGKPERDIEDVFERISTKERPKFNQFKDLLLKMFNLDPSKRITPEAAMKHPFIVAKRRKKKVLPIVRTTAPS